MWEVSGSGPGCQSGYRSGDLWSYDTPVWEVSGSGPGCQSVYIGVVTYEAMTPQFRRSVVQVLVVRVYMSDFTVNQAKSVTYTWLFKDAFLIEKVINFARKISLLRQFGIFIVCQQILFDILVIFFTWGYGIFRMWWIDNVLKTKYNKIKILLKITCGTLFWRNVDVWDWSHTKIYNNGHK